jgi:hypothetical protein
MSHPILVDLLQRRLAIIADHELRDRDPAAQLAALKEVSKQIQCYHAEHRSEFDARLEHFLSGCSFDKALRYLESEGEWRGH